MFLHDKFPRLYNNLIPQVLDLEVPTEVLANCSQCHLSATDKKSHSLTKCCTYHANLPNYMVGALLCDDGKDWQEGKRRVIEKIEKKIGVTPYGIISPLEFQELKIQRAKEGRMDILPFEVRTQLTCPYLDKGMCTVWKYRSELCITYFCNSIGGRQGKNFWNKMFTYVRALENKLQLYALKQIGYTGNLTTTWIEPSTFNLQKEDGSIKEQLYKNLWGTHINNEVHVYKACYDAIKDLTPQKAKEVLGWEIEWMEKEFRKSLEIFKRSLLPEHALYDVENKVAEADDNRYNITSKKGKTITVNKRMYLTLKSFDGKKNLQDIQRQHLGLLPINDVKYRFFLNAGILKPMTS